MADADDTDAMDNIDNADGLDIDDILPDGAKDKGYALLLTAV
jgi:hypothetical protein